MFTNKPKKQHSLGWKIQNEDIAKMKFMDTFEVS